LRWTQTLGVFVTLTGAKTVLAGGGAGVAAGVTLARAVMPLSGAVGAGVEFADDVGVLSGASVMVPGAFTKQATAVRKTSPTRTNGIARMAPY